LTENDKNMLKAATGAAYEALGGVSRTADRLGVASSTLTKYASTGADWRQNFIRLDLAVALDRASAHPFLMTAMSELVRGRAGEGFGAVTAAAVLRLNGVLDDVVRKVALALEDGVLDAGERLAIRNTIVAAQRNLAALDAVMIGGG
jgi:hypothetical protein